MKRENRTLVTSFTLISLLLLLLFANVCKLREKEKVKSITTKVTLDTRRALKDGTFPLKLRFTCSRKSKYIALNFSCTELDFYKALNQNGRGKLKELRLRIHTIEARATKIASEMTDCDFEDFKNRFLERQPRADVRYIQHWLQEKIDTVSNPNTKELYQLTMNKLPGKVLLDDITPVWLERWKIKMQREGMSVNSVAIHLRNLRHCYRNAMFEDAFSATAYPFDGRRFQVPSSQNVKKALSFSEIRSVFEYRPADAMPERLKSWELFARDVWRLMYLVNGMNPVDLAGLLYSNINGDMITFYRKKTIGKTKHIRPVSSVLHPEALRIIEEWGQKPATPQTYVFGVLGDKMSEEQKRRKVKQWTKQLNKYLKRIGEVLDLPIKLTTMTARHSHANVLMNAGAPREFIQRSLGHASAKTTENYLDSFESEKQKEFLNYLTNWQ